MSEPIRLVAVHQGGGIGGAPVSLLKLVAGLDARAFESTVVVTEDGPILGFARQMGVRVEVVPAGGAFFYSAHARLGVRTTSRFVRTFPSAVRAAQAALRRLRPDVLHLNTSVLLAWAVAARREQVPVVWVVREVLGPNELVRAWHVRQIQRHAARIVAISGAVRECFPRAAQVEVVPNAVDLAEFDPGLLAERNAVRAEIGLGEADLAVMCIGSVQREKGHWLLLEAFEQLAKWTPEARLVLVAGGVDDGYRRSAKGWVKTGLGMPMDNLDAWLRDAARRGLEDRVRVTGFRRDVARVLAAADVVIFPSERPEGFGRPLIEAMAMQRPVVATDVGPSAEILGPEAGVFVPPEARALADALQDVLSSPERRMTMGRAGRHRVEHHFDLATQVERFAGVYQNVSALRAD